MNFATTMTNNYNKVEQALQKLSCPICNETADDLEIGPNVFAATTSCTHDRFITILRNEYSRLMQEHSSLATTI